MTVRIPVIPAICTHEAAHAVIALVLGRAVPYATSRSIEGAAGHCQIAGMYVGDDETDVVILLAGLVAEAHAGYPVDAHRSSDEDVRFARAIARWTLAPDRRWIREDVAAAFKASAESAARHVVHHWSWILRVARALEQRTGLTGPEILALRDGPENPTRDLLPAEAAALLVGSLEGRGATFTLTPDGYLHANLDGIGPALGTEKAGQYASAIHALRPEIKSLLAARKVLH
jgi:hypothetical protein